MASEASGFSRRRVIVEAHEGQQPVVRFDLDEGKAREFLSRALRRYGGTLRRGEGAGAGRDEDWELESGWDLTALFSDEAPGVENLVQQAVHEAGAITCTAEGMELELLIDAPLGDSWMHQWRISLPGSASFALCSPYREEFRMISQADGTPSAKGCRAALGILREACAAANKILDGYALLGGRARPDLAGDPRLAIAVVEPGTGPRA